MNIYLDIETIPGPTPPCPENIKAPANYKDKDKIASYRAEAVEAEWRKEALHPMRGRIFCIGYAFGEGAPRIIFGAEKEMIVELEGMVIKAIGGIGGSMCPSYGAVTWIGHNISEFDLVWIKLRAMKYKCRRLCNIINLDRYRGNFIDTKKELGSWRDNFSLDDACKFFDIGGKPENIDGSSVFDYWRAARNSEILEYCANDVEITRSLHKRIEAF